MMAILPGVTHRHNVLCRPGIDLDVDASRQRSDVSPKRRTLPRADHPEPPPASRQSSACAVLLGAPGMPTGMSGGSVTAA
jgi:hypothetical protein